MRPPTNPTAIAFQSVLNQLGLTGQVVEFEQTTRTAADAAAAIGCELGQIVKSLIFQTKHGQQPVLVFTSGVNRVDERLVESLVGEPLVKADTDLVRSATGYAIGGVPPFGYPHPPHSYLDEALMRYDIVWAAAGTPYAVFPLTPAELQSHSGAKIVKVAQERS